MMSLYTDIFLTTYGILYLKGGVAKKSLAYVLFLSIYSQKFLIAPFLIPHKLWGVDNKTEKIQWSASDVFIWETFW